MNSILKEIFKGVEWLDSKSHGLLNEAYLRILLRDKDNEENMIILK